VTENTHVRLLEIYSGVTAPNIVKKIG